MKPDTITGLRIMSGLTSGQIARLFGVPHRTVQSWAAGTPLPAQHEARLENLYARIRPLAATAERRRAELLRSSTGRSHYHQMVAENLSPAVIQTTTITVRDRLAAE